MPGTSAWAARNSAMLAVKPAARSDCVVPMMEGGKMTMRDCMRGGDGNVEERRPSHLI